MAIVRLKPDVEIKADTTIPTVTPNSHRSNFTELVPVSRIESLLKYVEGYPWTVDYFGIIRSDGNTIEHFDPTTPNLIQSYYKVNQLIMHVSSPLSSSYDQNTGITTINGTSLMPFGVTPNVGDLFLANVDTGEDAYFHVTSVSRKLYTKNSLYEINYNLHIYNSDDESFGKTLNSRVNSDYFFNKDSDRFNRDLLIKPSVKEAMDRLKVFMVESQDYYFRTFPQNRTGTILIPGVKSTMFDPLLVEFISKIVSYERLCNSRVYSHTHNDKYVNQSSIWDMLITRSLSMLPVTHKQHHFVRTGLLKSSARLGTVVHTGVEYILYPVTPNTGTNLGKDRDPIYDPSEAPVALSESNYFIDESHVLETTNNDSVYSKKLLHPLFENNYYVVSEGFYKYLNNKSEFDSVSFIELLIYKFLKGDAIAREDLALAIQNYPSWSLLHQLYLLPVMWLLTKTQLSSMKF